MINTEQMIIDSLVNSPSEEMQLNFHKMENFLNRFLKKHGNVIEKANQFDRIIRLIKDLALLYDYFGIENHCFNIQSSIKNRLNENKTVKNSIIISGIEDEISAIKQLIAHQEKVKIKKQFGGTEQKQQIAEEKVTGKSDLPAEKEAGLTKEASLSLSETREASAESAVIPAIITVSEQSRIVELASESAVSKSRAGNENFIVPQPVSVECEQGVNRKEDLLLEAVFASPDSLEEIDEATSIKFAPVPLEAEEGFIDQVVLPQPGAVPEKNVKMEFFISDNNEPVPEVIAALVEAYETMMNEVVEMPKIDLRKKSQFKWKITRFLSLMVLPLITLLALITFGSRLFFKVQAQDFQSQIEINNALIGDLQKKIEELQEYEILKNEIDGKIQKIYLLKNRQPGWSSILKIFSAHIPAEIGLERFRATHLADAGTTTAGIEKDALLSRGGFNADKPGYFEISFSGNSSDQNNIQKFIAKLESCPGIGYVDFNKINSQKDPENKAVRFSLTGKVQLLESE